jgi:tetratricopeptide (TPR) repeat protein
MEPMTTRRVSLLGPLTRNEEIQQFERLRHQIHIVESLRGLKITAAPVPLEEGTKTVSPVPMPWRKLQTVGFSDLVMDQVQTGCMLKCRTVVQPLVLGSLQVLVEELDRGYRVMMLSVENYINASNVMEMGAIFPVGRELWIRNPCVRAHEGRPVIRVEDPINVKVRQSSKEIERILEFGPADARGWKIKGNSLFKRGKLEDAAQAYSNGLNLGANGKLRSSLLRRRAESLFLMDKYQLARLNALSSLSLVQNDKTLFLLGKIFLKLRSFSNGLKYVQEMTDRDPEADALLRQLWICDLEHREGAYNTIAIAEEAHLNDRVVHADFVSPNIELRREGIAGRGMFAKKDLPAGTLLIASKAVLCVYVDELPSQNGHDDEKGINDRIREEFVERLIQMINNGTGRRIFNLAGGIQQFDSTFDLNRDDVYDDPIHYMPDQIKDIVARNSFGGAQRSHLLARAAEDGPHDDPGGGALFYAPSFLNHSCIPNATYFTIGDMMFIKANRDIEQNEELTIHYVYVDGLSEPERAETLQRVWNFTCYCDLCAWERENDETCKSANQILQKCLPPPKDDPLKKLLSAKKKLYSLYRWPAPQIDLLTCLSHPPATLPAGLTRTLIPLLRELSKLARDSSARNTGEIIAQVNGEYHFTLKLYSHFERIGIAGMPALRVWEWMVRNYEGEDVAIADEWLKEARRTHDMFLGDGHFEYQHGSFVREVRSELV